MSEVGKLLATVSWCAEDIQSLRPAWSAERCEEFLDENEDGIQCAMVETGWSVISDLLRGEP